MAPDLRQALIELGRRAGAIALRHYGAVACEEKQDHSPVTAADREVEAFLRGELAALDPGAAYVGEETVDADAAAVERARAAERVWVVDPIDGTAAFLGELDTFSVCIGLLRRGRPHAGVVHLPALGQTYSAVRGEGARWSTGRGEQPLDAGSQAARVPATTCLLAPSRSHLHTRITYPGKVRSLGCTSLHFVLVARGVGVGAFSRSCIWDWAAAAAILEEAGGVLRYLDGTNGGELDWRELLDGRQTAIPVLGAHPRRWGELAGCLQQLEAGDP
jgi:myo-inositol-1(or 4)-monophosphatase